MVAVFLLISGVAAGLILAGKVSETQSRGSGSYSTHHKKCIIFWMRVRKDRWYKLMEVERVRVPVRDELSAVLWSAMPVDRGGACQWYGLLKKNPRSMMVPYYAIRQVKPSGPAGWGTCRAKRHRFCWGNPSLDHVPAHRPTCSAAVAAIHDRGMPPARWSQRERAVSSPPGRRWWRSPNPRARACPSIQKPTINMLQYMVNVDL